jgi:Mlc titration factor MtfA (ptsG expression regulator)
VIGWLRNWLRGSAPPFPDAWLGILERNVAHYPLLSPAQQARLRHGVAAMVATKTWEGCNGLTVTDEMKVTIAAQACLMLLGREERDPFARVLSILVYPTGFTDPPEEEEDEDEGWDEEELAGRSVYRGPVILSWDAVLEEGRDPALGWNLVIHEFAHQLDDLDGLANGTPALLTDGECETWRQVMTAEYTRLLRDLRRGRETFLGDYAAEDESEFFAVASERFFTLPERLRHYHPSLYDLLKSYYRLDPMEWFAG